MTGYESDPGDEQPETFVLTTPPQSSGITGHWMRPGTVVEFDGRNYEVVRWIKTTLVEVCPL